MARVQGRPGNWGEFSAIGWANADGEIKAGVVFNGYDHPNILFHISAETLTPEFVYAFLRYPFLQLKVNRITGLIARKNKKCRRFAVHLGATLEGTMHKALANDDVCIYGLFQNDAQKWLDRLGKKYG